MKPIKTKNIFQYSLYPGTHYKSPADRKWHMAKNMSKMDTNAFNLNLLKGFKL